MLLKLIEIQIMFMKAECYYKLQDKKSKGIALLDEVEQLVNDPNTLSKSVKLYEIEMLRGKFEDQSKNY